MFLRSVRINQTVYIINYYNIGYHCLYVFNCTPSFVYKTTVEMKNKTHFITPEIFDDCKIESVRRKFSIENDYGCLWFKSLKDVKDYLNKMGYKLGKTRSDNYWNVEEVEHGE